MSFPCIKCWKRNLRFGKGEKYGSSRGPGTIYEKQTFLKDHWQNIREQLKEGSKNKKSKDLFVVDISEKGCVHTKFWDRSSNY